MHPVWMVLSLVLALAAMRLGMRMRRERGARKSIAATRHAHLRLARPAVALLLLGFLGGPLSAVWLRGWNALDTLHGWLGLLAAALFVAAALFGRRLEQGRLDARTAHAGFAGLAVLVAAVAAVAGFVLLP